MRVLVVIQGEVGARMTGPEIRGWALARALAGHHSVTVAVDDPPGQTQDGLSLVSNRRRELIREARRHDAVLAPALPLYLLAALWSSPTVTVSDQYDPVWLETAVLTQDSGTARRLRAQQLMRSAQLRFTDVIAVAGDAQRRLLVNDLKALPRARPAPPSIVSVPFGVPEPPGPAEHRPLRAAFPQIGPDDPLILWWGKVWKWFDAETAIRAFAQVVARRPDARMVITAGKSPTAAFEVSDRTEAARELGRSLGLLERNLFFLEEWTQYDRRHEYLLDADIGLTLHGNTAEAPFAARARYMDYLWTALPCVLGEGDETAARFAEAGLASLVAPGDVNGAAAAVLRLIDNPPIRQAARAAGERLVREYQWSAVVQPLIAAVEKCHADLPGPGSRRRLLSTAGRYYLHRIGDHAVAIGRGAGA